MGVAEQQQHAPERPKRSLLDSSDEDESTARSPYGDQPSTSSGFAHGGGGGGDDDLTRAVTSPASCRDAPFAFLFLFTLGMVGLVAGLYGGKKADPQDPVGKVLLDWTWFVVPILVVPFTIVIGGAYLLLLRVAAMPFIMANLWTFNVMLWSLGILAAVAGQIVLCVLLLLFALIDAGWIFSSTRWIKFTADLMRVTLTALQDFPGVYYIAYVFLFLHVVSILAFATLGMHVYASRHETPDSDAYIAVLFFLLFSFFWTFEVLRNVTHTTVAGVMGTFYFAGSTDPARLSSNPTLRALGRALGPSFGSICFGSLLVAVLSTIRVTAALLRERARRNNNAVLYIVACCCQCLAGCVEGLLKYFNRYAFVQVALYGKPYIAAGRDAWDRFTERGLDMLMTDDVTGTVVVIASLVTALLAWGTTALSFYLRHDDRWLAVSLLAFCVAFLLARCVLGVGYSAVTAIFVCYAEWPEILHERHPDLAAQFADARQDGYNEV